MRARRPRSSSASLLVCYITLARPYANLTRDPVYASAHASKVISLQPQAPLRNAFDAPPRKLLLAAPHTTTHSTAAARMLKQLFAPTKGNLLGWAAAAAVVGAWQYFTSGPDAVDDTLAFNQKIINENKKKP